MSDCLSPSDIAQIFAEEIAAARGEVTDPFVDGTRVFVRGVLPPSIEVAPKDSVRGGVALSATDTDIYVHPYVFRIVCTNGAIMAKATQTRRIERDEFALESSIRQAIGDCCRPESFIMAADQIRSSREIAADMAIMMAAFDRTRRGTMWTRFFADILRRYHDAADTSAFGLMNAVTSVARDTREPEARWRLEVLGGTIPAMLHPGKSPRRPARPAARSLVQVG